MLVAYTPLEIICTIILFIAFAITNSLTATIADRHEHLASVASEGKQKLVQNHVPSSRKLSDGRFDKHRSRSWKSNRYVYILTQ